MLLESQLRHLINNLLIEAKADVLAARHPHIDVHALAALDPTSTKKYLEWMIKVVDGEEILDFEELGLTIRQFDSVVQRLSGKQRDINTYKSLNDLQNTLNDIGTQSKTKQKQTTKASGSQHVGTVDGWDVYFITSHKAAMLLGKGTKWCITQKNCGLWDDYVRDVKFFYALRKVEQGDSLDKIAYACYLNTDEMEIFDAQDTSLYLDDSDIIELTNFINHTKNRYNTYTVTSKNQTLEVTNNKWSGSVMKDDGTKIWLRNGMLHREGAPAIERPDGTKEWWINGKRHREDGPAVEAVPVIEAVNGVKQWWVHGEKHREDGPAVEYTNGDKEWWLYGVRHREDGPAIELVNGHEEWFLNGERHREGAPAIERPDGTKEWWIDGLRHREDGPAIERSNGRHKEWWLYGVRHREDGPAIETALGTKMWYLNDIPYDTEAEYKRALKQLGK